LLCCPQGILQGLELYGIYQIGVEFTRALRDGVKQLLRQCKLPKVRPWGQGSLHCQRHPQVAQGMPAFGCRTALRACLAASSQADLVDQTVVMTQCAATSASVRVAWLLRCSSWHVCRWLLLAAICAHMPRHMCHVCAVCAMYVQVAAAGSHDLWLKWIDALIRFTALLTHVLCVPCVCCVRHVCRLLLLAAMTCC
jgi:hypothetical protein